MFVLSTDLIPAPHSYTILRMKHTLDAYLHAVFCHNIQAKADGSSDKAIFGIHKTFSDALHTHSVTCSGAKDYNKNAV